MVLRKCSSVFFRGLLPLLLTLVVICCGKPADAQFNDSVFHYVGVFSTGSLNQTDATNTYLLNNVLKYGIKKKKYGLNTAGSWTYGEQNRVLTNNDVNASAMFEVNSSVSRVYYWAQGSYQSSYSLKINNQYQGGIGLAYDVVSGKHGKINLSDGLLYENNDIFKNDTERLQYSTLRNSLKVQFEGTLADKISVNGGFFYQNSFNDGQDYILKANLTLLVRVRKWLTFTTTYAYNRFNITAKENSLFTYGITIEHYY